MWQSLCDELVVGLHSNAEILHQKGPPVMSNEERLATVKACKWVTEVVFDTPYNPTVALLDSLQCDFCVHGDDDALDANGTDAFAEVKAKGRMAIVKRTEGVSTTDLVNRLLQRTQTSRNNNAPDTNNARTVASSPQLIEDAEAAVAAAAAAATTAAVSNHSLSPSSPPPPAAPASTFLLTTWRLSQFANHRIPRKSDTCVYIAGSFDLFHVGHIEKLAAAKKLGTFLYVGIYDDATIRSYKGGAIGNSPVMNLHERVLNVLQCKHVDEVVIGAPWTITPDLIKTLNVAVVARCKSVAPCSSRRARVHGKQEEKRRMCCFALMCFSVVVVSIVHRAVLAICRCSTPSSACRIPLRKSSRWASSPTSPRRQCRHIHGLSGGLSNERGARANVVEWSDSLTRSRCAHVFACLFFSALTFTPTL